MRKILPVILALFVCSYTSAGLTSDTYELTVKGFTFRYFGGAFSDGKRLVLGDGGTNCVYIFNAIPTGSVYAGNASCTISGFNSGIYQAHMPNPCIVGNKLLVSDSDPAPGGNGYHIKIWNSIPTTDTVAGSCNYRITGFGNLVSDIRTDGTKFCATGPTGSAGIVRIWNSVPDGNVDVSNANAYSTDGYGAGVGFFGASGKFYVSYNSGTSDTHYISVFNSVPSGAFSVADTTSVRVTFFTGGTGHGSFEIRNMLYAFGSDTASRVHFYIWRNIPSSNTDTSTINNDYFLYSIVSGSLPTDSLRANADLQNIYLWLASKVPTADGVRGYKNDYDTFTVTGTSLAPSSIDQRHKDCEMEKIRVYTYPGRTTLNSIKLLLTGNCVDTDVSKVSVYDDVNNDGDYDQGTDNLLGAGTFSGKTVEITNLNFAVSAGEKNILITYDISENSVLNNTVGVSVEHFIFDKYLHHVPTGMSSSFTAIVPFVMPSWNSELRIVNTKNQIESDTLYTISLDWDDASGGAPPLVYKLYHIIDNSETIEFLETQTHKIIYNLDISKKHRFRVKVIDAFGNQPPESNLAYDETSPEWSKTFRISDTSRQASEDKWEYRIRVYWEPGRDSASKDIRYEISVKEEGKDWEVKAGTWENSYEIPNLTGIVYVRMRARDCAGNYTDYSSERKILLNPFLTYEEENAIDEKGGKITLADLEDERIEIEFPESALNKRYNVTVEKDNESEYTYNLTICEENGIERKIIFKKPVTITIFYNESRLAKLGFREEDVHILYNDGIRWQNIGGEVNRNGNYVKVKVYRFSKYKMSGEKDNTKRITVSSEVITPNNDEINDVLVFNASWDFSENISIRIYDVNGREVWEYTGSEKTVVWQCRAYDNVPLESGIYLYAVKVENRTFNGTVMVVK